jgi:tetratricopeptide (TPR) repeat protein
MSNTLARIVGMRNHALFLVLFVTAFGFAQAPTEGSKDPKVLLRLQKTFEAAAKALSNHPKDPKAKDAYVVAGVRYGHESMVSPLLGPKVKYPQALRIYRKVLIVDPKNPIAKPESDMIISIYKQMGRPIPK